MNTHLLANDISTNYYFAIFFQESFFARCIYLDEADKCTALKGK